jgi:ribosomal protein S18 acetylase RimI-like enzyme
MKSGLMRSDSTSGPIRLFSQADEEAVIALWRNVFGYEAAHNDPATVIRKKMEADPGFLWVAVEEDGIVGTVMAGYDGHRGWIYSLAVDARHRRRGLGTALVRFAEEELKRRGCMKINLQLLASNAETMAFYQRLGYQTEPRISMGKVV